MPEGLPAIEGHQKENSVYLFVERRFCLVYFGNFEGNSLLHFQESNMTCIF